MNKKLIIILSLVAVVIIGLIFVKGDLLQGRLRLVPSQKLSSIMQPLCLTPDQYYEKYVKPKKQKEEKNSGSGSGGGTESKDKTIIVPPEFIVGGPPSGGVLEDNKDNSYTEPEEKVTNDGSKEKPYSEYVDCKCGEEGKNLGTYQNEQGEYLAKICMESPFWECVRPQFRCPKGTEPDFTKITEICKKEKAKSCFSAAKPSGETYDMCKALANEVFDLDCISKPECKKYLEMSEKELDNYIQALGLPEKFFEKGGDSYKPENEKEKQSIEELDKISDCYNLYT